jgi:hypothetical protein
MTPDGIRYREFDMAQYVAEACALIRRTIGNHNREYAAARYGIDDWEITGAQEGTLNPRKALSILHRDNELMEAGDAPATN